MKDKPIVPEVVVKHQASAPHCKNATLRRYCYYIPGRLMTFVCDLMDSGWVSKVKSHTRASSGKKMYTKRHEL